MTILRDAGHQMPNNEKVLLKGLKGIKEEVEWYMAQLDPVVYALRVAGEKGLLQSGPDYP